MKEETVIDKQTFNNNVVSESERLCREWIVQLVCPRLYHRSYVFILHMFFLHIELHGRPQLVLQLLISIHLHLLN